MLLYIFAFLFSFLLLARASSSLVLSLSGLARFFQLSEYIISFFLMSAATSIPELFIGISSALGGTPSLSLGNIIGSNLINISLVAGLAAFLSNGIKVESKIRRENFFLIFLMAFLPLFLALDGVISRWDGAILLLSFFIYILRLVSEKEYFKKILDGVEFNFNSLSKAFRNMLRLLLSILMLLFASYLLVWSAQNIMSSIEMGGLLFGIFFIAIGTTLPELFFGIRASLMKHKQMTLGNSIGSVAFNSAFVIGAVSILAPIHMDDGFTKLFPAVIFLFAAFLFFNFFLYTRSRISRREGFILALLYLAFIFVEYFA